MCWTTDCFRLRLMVTRGENLRVSRLVCRLRPPASCILLVSLCSRPPACPVAARQNVRGSGSGRGGARGGAAVPRAGLPPGARRGPPETPQQLSFAVRIVMAGNGTLETKHVTISKTFPGPLFLLPPYAVKRAGIDPPTPKTLFKWKKLRLKYANNRCSGHGQWHGGVTLCFGVCL